MKMTSTNLKMSFSDQERSLVRKFAKSNKFRLGSEPEILYYKEPIKVLRLFCDSYRLLYNISNQGLVYEVKEGEQKPKEDVIDRLLKKINEYLKDQNELHTESLKLVNSFDSGVNFGKSELIRQAEVLFEKNKILILNLVDVVHSLGKVEQQYDPSKAQGYY